MYIPGSIAEAAHKWQEAERQEGLARDNYKVARQSVRELEQEERGVIARAVVERCCKANHLKDLIAAEKRVAKAAEHWAEVKAAKEAR